MAGIMVVEKISQHNLFFTYVEVRNPKSVSLGQNQGTGSATLSPEVLGKNPFLASFSF